MSNLIKHAKKELGFIYDKEDLKVPYNKAAYDAVIELIKVFSKQGHSGFSAPYTINTFKKLAMFETLSPLTGEDDEWGNVSDRSGEELYQNKRNSSVFKDKKGAYCIDGVIWKGLNGTTWANKKSTMYIKSFPFTPKTFYVDSYEDESYNKEQYQEALDYYNNYDKERTRKH